MRPTRGAPRHRGTSLLEALIALLVMSLGMLAIARLQTHTRLHADLARQHSQAVRLAQDELEALHADLGSETHGAESQSGDATQYLVERRIEAIAPSGAHHVHVSVAWVDRSGAAQQLTLHSIVAVANPAHSGALGLARGAASIGTVGRSSRVPVGATDLRDGRSAFKPIEGGAVAILFDNLSGDLVGRCTGVDPNIATPELTVENLGECDAIAGLWLSGVVRFSAASPPDAARAVDIPAPFAVQLTLAKGSHPAAPACTGGALPAVGSDRHAVYHCTVYPRVDGRWSGKLTLVPTGWAIGTGEGARRVCRYATDLDGSGAIDANLEHPEVYVDVDLNLPNQNFLVIAGEETCPAAPTGNNGGVDRPPNTVQHQP
jgi:Tfp pilus assembly protein PilV